jgi:hypothetical protein
MKHIGVVLALTFALTAILPPALAQDADTSKAWVKDKEGIKILHVAGTPYEMGVQQGKAMRDEIREMMSSLWLGPITQLIGDQMPVARDLANRIAAMCPGYLLEEMRGIADGAGVAQDDVIFGTLIADQVEHLAHTGRLGDETPAAASLLGAPLGCSNFACFGRATKTGELYHGVNFDWRKELGIQKHYVVIAREPDGGTPFVTIGWAGTLYTTATMNAHKISTGFVGFSTANTPDCGFPMGLVHRRIAQEAKTLDDAIGIITSVPRTPYGGINYVIADGKVPDAVAVETDSKHASVWGANDPREKDVYYAIPLMDTVVRSDEAMDPRVRDAQTCTNGDPSKPGLEAPWGTESYDHRYKGLCVAIMHDFGAIDDAKALAMVRAAHMERGNMHSVLWCPSRLEFYLATAKGDEDAADRPYVHFTWDDLFPAE